MNLYIASDLHIDAFYGGPDSAFRPHPEALAISDVIVLAGDICNGRNHPEGGAAVRWVRNSFPGKPVVLVPGNHEFYGQEFALLDGYDRDAQGSQVHVLDRRELILGEGRQAVRFLGCTLWTDMRIGSATPQACKTAISHIREAMSDFHAIRVTENGQVRTLTPQDTIAQFYRSLRWLIKKLKQPFNGKTVVVTHHCPSPRSIDMKYVGHPLNAAFVSNLEWLMGDNSVIDLWVHGHTHSRVDYRLGKTRVICNPRGYPSENSNFAEWVCSLQE